MRMWNKNRWMPLIRSWLEVDGCETRTTIFSTENFSHRMRAECEEIGGKKKQNRTKRKWSKAWTCEQNQWWVCTTSAPADNMHVIGGKVYYVRWMCDVMYRLVHTVTHHFRHIHNIKFFYLVCNTLNWVDSAAVITDCDVMPHRHTTEDIVNSRTPRMNSNNAKHRNEFIRIKQQCVDFFLVWLGLLFQ